MLRPHLDGWRHQMSNILNNAIECEFSGLQLQQSRRVMLSDLGCGLRPTFDGACKLPPLRRTRQPLAGNADGCRRDPGCALVRSWRTARAGPPGELDEFQEH